MNYDFDVSDSGLMNNNLTLFSENYNKQLDNYKSLKNEIKLFFSSKSKNMVKLKNFIAAIFKQQDTDDKRNKLHQIISFVSDNITVNKIGNASKKNKNVVCSKLSKKKCLSKNHCELTDGNKKIVFDLDSLNLGFNFNRCKLKLNSNLKKCLLTKL